MKKMKLCYKAVLSLILSAVLFGVPAVACYMNEGNVMYVSAGGQESEDCDSGEIVAEEDTGSGLECSRNESVSGGDAKPECTCGKKCSVYDYDRDCGVCMVDYRQCEYKMPNVSINIIKPDGWHSGGSVTVKFNVLDVAHTGNFETASIQARIGQNGSWADVTEDRELEISENCTVYVQVTDQKGNIYEKNRFLKCFDTTKPTLNAAVSDGLLTVQVSDLDSGAKAVYVNGYEFTELTEGVLNIRLQQFDAGYEYFTIYVMDNAGNLSDVYKTKNPYYKSPDDDSDENPAGQLPVSAGATKPGSASAVVTEHTKTDSTGNTVSPFPAQEESNESGREQSERGREFYTIQTASEKVFYLIVDRNGEDEMVYFLTEITENDLLNVTSGNSETLPKNSAAVESAIPIEESALPNNNNVLPANGTEQTGEGGDNTDNTADMGDTGDTEDTEQVATENEAKPLNSYIIMGVLGVAVIGGAYYFKVVRKKKEDFVEDEDEDAEDNEEYEDEWDESEEGSDDAFFDDNGEE